MIRNKDVNRSALYTCSCYLTEKVDELFQTCTKLWNVLALHYAYVVS